MEIHYLNEGTLQSTDYVAIDNGSDTRKYNIGAVMGATPISDIGDGTVTGAISVLNGKLTFKNYVVTPVENAYVSPFGYHVEFTIPSSDQNLGSPVAWSISGGTSTDVAVVKRSSTYGFRIYASKSDDVYVNILFMQTS